MIVSEQVAITVHQSRGSIISMVVKVDLDIVYFTTMINNLLSNAVKYSERDPEISIEGFAR